MAAKAVVPVKTNSPPLKPADQLRAIGAPRELIEWARKQPTDTALRTAWVDGTRADWLPYVASVRGIATDTILRATCELAMEIAGSPAGPEAPRVLAVLGTGKRDALANIERDLADLRTQVVSWSTQTQPGAKPVWMFWGELAFELGRACSRGNPLVGVGLALRMLSTPDLSGKPKITQGELVARLREKLTLAG
jgi:hypothetical protein